MACLGVKADGRPCGHPGVRPSGYCPFHDPDQSAAVAIRSGKRTREPELAMPCQRFAGDPVGFMRSLICPETGSLFEPYASQERFLLAREALAEDGRFLYPEQVFSAPKKSGKTGFGGVTCLYDVAVVGGRYAEGYCCANDYEQSQGRVFQAVTRIVRANLEAFGPISITRDRITFKETGAFIQAIANDFAGAAGANPTISVFDELWGFVSERSRRLWDEMVPPPTRVRSCRLTVTYAGFEGESVLLEELYKRGVSGEVLA